ncbi:MAG: hypothetical protein IJK73_06655 [Bacteroidales bacterium]|nr:hypothetical protein [Bacteroidales bacterium]
MRIGSVAAICAVITGICSCDRNIVPEGWLSSWNEMSINDRPVKIVHRIPGDGPAFGGNYFTFLRDSCGVGGAILNYSGKDYLKDEGEWAFFVDEVRRAEDAGLRVWIYDEEGYPSLGAGGRVLEKAPELEAKEMVFDSSLPEGQRYYVRPSYEYTHACNNYAALRRYPDPGDPRTMQVFTDVTHEATRRHLGPDIFGKIESFFTDEPSYMGVNLGPIPEKVRNTVRVQDEPDPGKKLLPMIPWSEGIDKDYAERYGEALDVPSLFGGDSESDKVVRQRYWELLGERFRSNYCDSLQKWCSDAGTLSSGHFLSEEQIIRHTPLYGNMLLVERGLDIPGLDMLDTDPGAWNTGDCWLIASLPESAAYIDGKRRVMSEISDHNQAVLGDGPATVEAMKGTAACHMAGGVTDLNLYYPTDCGEAFPYRNPAAYKSYSEFVARINSIVRTAEPVKKVLLYYPAYDLQREFIPETEPLMDERNQSPTMQTVIGSTFSTGQSMAQAQIPFVLADYLALENAEVQGNLLKIGNHGFESIVIPSGVTLPEKTSGLLERFRAAGGKVLEASPKCTVDEIIQKVDPVERINPRNPQCVFGKFERDGRSVYLLLNASDKAYEGTLTLSHEESVVAVLDPDTGSVSTVTAPVADGMAGLPVKLAPLQTLIFVTR